MESGKVDREKITLAEPKKIKFGTILPILYEGKALKVHLKYADFVVFENPQWKTKSVKISGFGEEDLFNLREIRNHIISLAGRCASLVAARPRSLKSQGSLQLPSVAFSSKEFKLLKGNHIFAKIERSKIWKKLPGNKKSAVNSISNLPMNGEVVLTFKQVFLGLKKSITCVLDEALIQEADVLSFFAEEEVEDEWDPFFVEEDRWERTE